MSTPLGFYLARFTAQNRRVFAEESRESEPLVANAALLNSSLNLEDSGCFDEAPKSPLRQISNKSIQESAAINILHGAYTVHTIGTHFESSVRPLEAVRSVLTARYVIWFSSSSGGKGKR